MLTVGIITAPRATNYISMSLESYYNQWSVFPVVFAEPGMPQFRHKQYCDYVQNTEQAGIVRNWWNCMKYLYFNFDTPWHMICEDDIIWRKDAAFKIRRLIFNRVPTQCRMISPYCSKRNGVTGPATWRSPRMFDSFSWCGALCTIWHRDWLEQLLRYESEFFEVSKNGGFEKPTHLDATLGYMVRTFLDGKILCHMPTLIDHLGFVSSNERNNPESRELCEARTPLL